MGLVRRYDEYGAADAVDRNTLMSPCWNASSMLNSESNRTHRERDQLQLIRLLSQLRFALESMCAFALVSRFPESAQFLRRVLDFD